MLEQIPVVPSSVIHVTIFVSYACWYFNTYRTIIICIINQWNVLLFTDCVNVISANVLNILEARFSPRYKKLDSR